MDTKKLVGKDIIGNWVLEKEIGKGSFSRVWKAHHAYNGITVAIKIIETSTLSEKLRDCLKKEISTLLRVRHENIVSLIDVIEHSCTIYLITEYCAHGELSKWIRKGVDGTEALSFVYQIIRGLHHLHENGIIHRDIKPQNVLLYNKNIIKIADFGFAREWESGSLAETLCGSPLYMAPEILLQQQYDCKVDVWSLGVVIYEIYMRHPPFQGVNCQDLLRKIRRDGDNLSYKNIPSHVIDVLNGMLQPIPWKRMNMSEVKESFRRLIKQQAFNYEEKAKSPVVNERLSMIGANNLKTHNQTSAMESLQFEFESDRPETSAHASSDKTSFTFKFNDSNNSSFHSCVSASTEEHSESCLRDTQSCPQVDSENEKDHIRDDFVLITTPNEASFLKMPMVMAANKSESLWQSSPKFSWKTWTHFIRPSVISQKSKIM